MTASVPVGIIMGSQSDWETLRKTAETLDELQIGYETRVVSAHRTPDRMFEYASSAADRGLKVIIAGAGGAAHLPGMVASKTELPVVGVPVKSRTLNGVDSLLSIVQMPGGVPVGTMAIGKAGAINAALWVAAMLGSFDPEIQARYQHWRQRQTERVLADDRPGEDQGSPADPNPPAS